MNLLLDTNVLLFALNDDARLGGAGRALIESPSSRCYFSSISTWEVSIKHSKHPEDMPISPADFVTYCRVSGATELVLSSAQALFLGSLNDVHKDPFDRMLMAQAKSEGMLFLTCDHVLLRYPEPIVVDASA